MTPTLLDSKTIQETIERTRNLTPNSKGQWGKMSVSQMLAHCTIALETALGDHKPPRRLIGVFLAPFMRKQVIHYTMPKNSPTAPFLVIADERDFQKEQQRLEQVLQRFGVQGKAGMTSHPHAFLGKLSPEEWGIHAFAHLDFHLKQFGV